MNIDFSADLCFVLKLFCNELNIGCKSGYIWDTYGACGKFPHLGLHRSVKELVIA